MLIRFQQWFIAAIVITGRMHVDMWQEARVLIGRLQLLRLFRRTLRSFLHWVRHLQVLWMRTLRATQQRSCLIHTVRVVIVIGSVIQRQCGCRCGTSRGGRRRRRCRGKVSALDTLLFGAAERHERRRQRVVMTRMRATVMTHVAFDVQIDSATNHQNFC